MGIMVTSCLLSAQSLHLPHPKHPVGSEPNKPAPSCLLVVGVGQEIQAEEDEYLGKMLAFLVQGFFHPP
jgi:hypothetical protein